VRANSLILCIFQLASKFPDVVAMGFDFLHSSAQTLAPKFTTMEYNSIVEALMLASNAWNDANKQSAFIRTLINNAEWQEISVLSDSPQALTSIFPENAFFEKKIIFIRNLSILSAALKRIKKNQKVLQQNQNAHNAQTGSGISNGSSDLDVIHPAYDHIVPTLPIVLKLVKSLHSLSENPQLKFLMEMSEAEKASILGVHMGHSMPSSFDKGAAALGELSTGDGEKSHSEKLRVSCFNKNCILYLAFYHCKQILYLTVLYY
jgi:hypothetical protein